MMKELSRRLALLVFAVLLLGGLAGCAEKLHELPQELREMPGVPPALQELPGLLEELGLPDLSQVTDLPLLADLPARVHEPGSLVYSGPTDRRIGVGERIPGTDIALVSIGSDGAEFRIAGLRSVRAVGDSLDYDGDWRGAQGMDYSLRLRIYLITADHVRAGGVQQLAVRDPAPQSADVELAGAVLHFPVVMSLVRGDPIAGTTFGYAGMEERGAKLSGLPDGDYPFRKLGDSIRWRGTLRSGVSAEYNLRLLYYGNDGARIGGTVGVAIAPE
jgi:hypothetical protein